MNSLIIKFQTFKFQSPKLKLNKSIIIDAKNSSFSLEVIIITLIFNLDLLKLDFEFKNSKIQSSSPKIFNVKRKRAKHNDSNNSIYSYGDQIREKNEELEQQELLLLQYEDNLD
jgi:hypothetical protein